MSRTVRAQLQMTGTPAAAEALWVDASRWPDWVDGVAETESISLGWPQPRAEVIWRSFPAGRGRVRERVIDYQPAALLRLEVEDETLTGEQTVRFGQGKDEVLRVELELSYRPRSRSPVMPVVDFLFIRPAMRRSLQSTLGRFGAVLAAVGPELPVSPRPAPDPVRRLPRGTGF